MKNIRPDGRLLLDLGWLEHVKQCARCQRFDPARPMTAAGLCLEGAVLWKRENVKLRPWWDKPAPDEHHVSKDALQRVMRYRE